jgi:hypothetical protein
MLINEVFDNPYSLVTDTPLTNVITNSIRKSGQGSSGLIVYEVSDDPQQFFILIAVNGAWEVHHQRLQNGHLVSGEHLRVNQGPNPRYVSTAIQLYRARLDRGHTIRVVGTSEMWPTYERVIDRMLKQKGRHYITDEVDQNYIGIDGETYVAQVLRPRGKFREMFKNIKLPV